MADEPNFDISKGQGILATKRTDFQKHIDGVDFFQEATSVKLDPTINIGGEQDNVRDAIDALNGIVVSGAPDADATTKGILKLTNDLGGTADLPQVVGFRNRPITNAVPASGNTLVWNGSQWNYQTISGTFTAGEDLSGSASLQQVVGLTGDSGIVDVKADNLLFNNSNSDVEVGQESVSGSAGGSLSIKGQTSTTSSGGSLILQSGVGSSLDGYLGLSVGTNMLLSMNEPTTGNRIIGLGTDSEISNVQMPAGTGDHVVYVKNAQTNPSSNPTSGAILYSNNASLWTRRGSGSQFQIGDAQSIKGFDVNVSGIEDGYGLIYNASSDDWESVPLSSTFTAGGDLSGSSSSQTVIGIRGESVASTSPINGQVLTYTGSQWEPASVGSFSAGNDLSGTSSSQNVIQITGYDNGGEQQVDILAQNMLFDGYVDNVIFGQAMASGAPVDGYGRDFIITAQDGYRLGSEETWGGDLILHGGRNGNVGAPGGVKIQIARWSELYGGQETEETAIHIMATSSSNPLIGLFGSTSNILENPDGFNSSTENVVFWSSGDLDSADTPTSSSMCGLWYNGSDDVLWFADHRQRTALTTKAGTATISDLGTLSPNDVVFDDISVTNYESTDDLFVYFADPSAISGPYVIKGWDYQSFGTARVYFVSIDGTSPGAFDVKWVLIKRE